MQTMASVLDHFTHAAAAAQAAGHMNSHCMPSSIIKEEQINDFQTSTTASGGLLHPIGVHATHHAHHPYAHHSVMRGPNPWMQATQNTM